MTHDCMHFRWTCPHRKSSLNKCWNLESSKQIKKTKCVPRRFGNCQYKHACLEAGENLRSLAVMSQIVWHAGICAGACVVKWKIHTQRWMRVYQRLFIATSHHIACSLYDLIQPLSFYFSSLQSVLLRYLQLHDVWEVAISASCMPPLNFTAE